MPILASPVPVAAPPITGGTGGGTGGNYDGSGGGDPYIPAPRVPSPFTPLRMTWTGVDGSVWDLSDPNDPMRMMGGLEGLGIPAFEGYRDQPPGLHGARFKGTRVSEREVFWVVRLRCGSTSDFLAYDTAWWRSMSRNTQGTWTIEPPGREPRTLKLRLSGVDYSADFDPAVMGYAKYGVHLIADQPFWEGPTISRPFYTTAPVPFFSTSGSVLGISAGNTLGAATIDNPGDEPAWPIWTLNGPFASVTVGVGGKNIVVPFSLADGQSLTIDTRPDRQTAVDSNGADRVNDLGAVAFGQIPAGASVPLTITAAGVGAAMNATASLTPLYWRAW